MRRRILFFITSASFIRGVCERHINMNSRSGARSTEHRQGTADFFGTFSHAEQSEMASLAGSGILGVKATTVILDRKLDALWIVMQLKPDHFRLRVFDCVCYCFLPDPKEMVFDARGKRLAVAADCEMNLH